MQYILDALTKKHDTSKFDCGVNVLNLWLTGHALIAQNKRPARTFVSHKGDNVVAAFFSLSSHTIDRDTLEKKLGRGSPAQIPAVLLGKMALKVELQDRGLGKELLHAAFEMALRASDFAGARFLVVDALNEEVVGFYENNGFKKCLDSELRLARKISDIQRDLE